MAGVSDASNICSDLCGIRLDLTDLYARFGRLPDNGVNICFDVGNDESNPFLYQCLKPRTQLIDLLLLPLCHFHQVLLPPFSCDCFGGVCDHFKDGCEDIGEICFQLGACVLQVV